MKVAVIGAGISGLSVAFYLKKGGAEVKVFEKEKTVGGKMKTIHEDGYIIETGPNGFLDGKPYTLNLVKELGIESKLYRSSDKARKRFIYTNGRLVRLPESPIAFLASYLLSWKGKLRLVGEFLVPPKKEDIDESLSEFAKRRIGEEALEKLLDPMVAGIFAGDPDRLSLKAAFPAIYYLEKQYGGLIKGLIAKMKEAKKSGKKSGPAGPGGVLTSFKGGVKDLIDSLSEFLGDSIETEVEILGLDRIEKGWKVKYKKENEVFEETFDAIVFSTPAYITAKLLNDLNLELSKLLSEIEYSPISVVALGFEKKGLGHDLDGFGFLVPRSEKRKILGALWDSSVFPNRAPSGKALIRVMIGGARQPELALLPDEELVNIALKELRRIMKIRHYPEKIKVFKHEKGIPHYTVGHAERVEKIFRLISKYPGLYLCNNAYTGVGVNDCTKAAEEVARRILDG
ncbi:protoporphyrinogen oxidase [Desulfurobacterium thermolithotrophum DSM 11699]|uniref:Coproporphyrinogen III oxidase n=1 Tax=Desulfurobacterium thermolithotrophum (strain DSM 11699 / BSA) TaxID=868864 RepID=F0S1T7_DESTD|nr:protoporphyrinogen oxidase [Desulfurobacterium thermolithotrophum]ADY72942.1 protoporphyrinogen oxidase [Desulfurobacterium thermolithotrophum DSM 11699]